MLHTGESKTRQSRSKDRSIGEEEFFFFFKEGLQRRVDFASLLIPLGVPQSHC